MLMVHIWHKLKILIIPCQQFPCNQEPNQDCRNVPYPDCEKVHKLVPHQVSKRRPFRVCGNEEPYEISDAEINDFEIIEAGTKVTSFDDDEKDFSAIVFDA